VAILNVRNSARGSIATPLRWGGNLRHWYIHNFLGKLQWTNFENRSSFGQVM